MAVQRASSFVKTGHPGGSRIPGTKVGTQNSQLLISSGISSFDMYIGGGLPVGSLILVDEDVNGTFAKIFVKYFLAEGVLSRQGIHVCSKDVDPECLVNELPGPVASERNLDDEDEHITDEEMIIAWRYQKMILCKSQIVYPFYFGHYLDLTKTDPDMKKISEFSFWSDDKDYPSQTFEESDYANLLKSIKERLKSGKYFVSDIVDQRKILRLGLLQIGSPLWPKTDEFLPQFLYSLRALLRNSFSTCMVTVPFHLYKNKSLRAQCIHLSDFCIQLESFSGTPLENNPALSEFNGFFRIVKWAAINGLINAGSHFVDLAIKLRRKKLTIEELRLPPELEDITEMDLDSVLAGCGSLNSKLLEF